MKKIKIFLTGESGMLSTSIKNKESNKFEILNFSDLATYVNQYSYHFFTKQLIKKPEIDFTNLSVLKEVENRLRKISYNNEVWIIHSGAYVNTDKCEQFYYEATKTNVLGTQNLINLAKKINAKFIYFSTTAVFDPDSYMLNEGIFDETAKIDPKTIYGLTKYCGELAVKQSFNKDSYIIIKPVFIYGDAPNDNSSMIRKIIETIYLKQNGYPINKLNVYLSENYKKDYMRSEYFADMFLVLLENAIENKKIWGNDFIISRNDPKPFKYYLDLIFSKFNLNYKKDSKNYINLIESGDYLKTHNGISTNFYKFFPDFKLNKLAYDDNYGIEKTYNSVKKLNIKNI